MTGIEPGTPGLLDCRKALDALVAVQAGLVTLGMAHSFACHRQGHIQYESLPSKAAVLHRERCKLMLFRSIPIPALRAVRARRAQLGDLGLFQELAPK